VLETIFKKLSPEYIIIKDKSIKKKIYFNAIKYIKSDNNYIEIYTTTKTYVDRLKLSDLESILPQAIFIRTHRSYIVNKNFVDDFGYNELKIGDEIIPVSRQYKNNVDFLTD
jgi:DNA-binding LytR/AlgR family response regulator